MTPNEARSYFNTAVFAGCVIFTAVDSIRNHRLLKPMRETRRNYKAEQKKYDRQFKEIVSNL